ncbi:hypothetical protein ACTXT7_000331 [Hymenolepis weldensis]
MPTVAQIHVALKLAGFEVLGTRNIFTDVVPTLISSSAIGQSLLSVNFATNPIDRTADQRLYISAAPLQVVYDADTINKIADFFKLPEGLRLNEISSSMVPSLDEMKAMTTTGLRYLVSQRSYLDLRIDIQSSYFLLPELGLYNKGCRLIMVDFGSVSLRSIRAQLDLPRTDESTAEQTSLDSSIDSPSKSSTLVGRAQSDERYKRLMQASYEQLLSEAYDQFEISLTATQIILVRKGRLLGQPRSCAQTPRYEILAASMHRPPRIQSSTEDAQEIGDLFTPESRSGKEGTDKSNGRLLKIAHPAAVLRLCALVVGVLSPTLN